MDSNALAQAINNPDLLRKALADFQASMAEVGASPVQQDAAPTIDVPVRYVDPPVQLNGKLDLVVTFESEVLNGMPYDTIIQRVLDVLSGGGDAWSPKVTVGNLRLERQEYRDRPEPEPGPGRGFPGIGVGQGTWERPVQPEPHWNAGDITRSRRAAAHDAQLQHPRGVPTGYSRIDDVDAGYLGIRDAELIPAGGPDAG